MYPNLKLQLWKTGIRQNRLAQMLGMDEAALSKIVNGYREPGDALRKSIAGLLETDEAWLFRRAERGPGCQFGCGGKRKNTARFVILSKPMIITRSPLRISLGGGGTDLPSYYRDPWWIRDRGGDRQACLYYGA